MSDASKPVPTCIMLMSNNLSRFTDTKRKAAEFLLEHYELVLTLNVNELAARADSSPSTIIRICNELGYKRYQDFKIALAQEIRHPTAQISESLEPADGLGSIAQKVFQSNIEAISSTLKALDQAEFAKAARLIGAAPRLELYGFGGSASVVMDAAHKFLKIGRKASALWDNDLQAMSASLLGPGDVVLAVSHTGRNKALLYNLEIAKASGASVVVITNRGKSPILKLADAALFTASRETAFKSDALSSRIAELTIIDALFVAVAFENYDESYRSIAKTRSATVGKKESI